MKRFIKIWRTVRLLAKYWNVMSVSNELITDPNANRSILLSENLTLEEMDGVYTMATIYRILAMPSGGLRKDLEHLEEVLR